MRLLETSIERLNREVHIGRIEALAERYDDESVEAALGGNPRRAHYLDGWSLRLLAPAKELEAEGFTRLLWKDDDADTEA